MFLSVLETSFDNTGKRNNAVFYVRIQNCSVLSAERIFDDLRLCPGQY